MATNSAEAEASLIVRRDERVPEVAVVTLNRPQGRNALTAELKSELVKALEAVADDRSVRAVVLTGAGKAFSVGQDLGEHAQALRGDPSTAFDTVHEHYNPIVRTITQMPKPVVAAINGAAVGAGLGFALACDLRVAAETASFATAFAAIGAQRRLRAFGIVGARGRRFASE